jgi:hypothetical protein
MRKNGNSSHGSCQDEHCDPSTRSEKSIDSFEKMDKAIAEGAIAVFVDVKEPPFHAESELIDIKIILPSKWSSTFVQRIDECIDDFCKEKRLGKPITVDERSAFL